MLYSIGANIVFSPILWLFVFASAFPENRMPFFGLTL